jgi:protein-tyrosine phosphatase
MIERGFPTWLDRVEFWHVHDLDCWEPEEAIPSLYREVTELVERCSGAILPPGVRSSVLDL